MKQCVDCLLPKKEDDFAFRNKAKGIRRNCCKSCQRLYNAGYYSSNKDKWQKSNTERVASGVNAKLCRNGYRAHKSTRLAQQTVYAKDAYHTNPTYRLRVILRARLRAAVKYGLKSGSAVGDLGCTVDEFKKYLESKFQPGMTWDNHGRKGWHIDHIKPLAAFDLAKREQVTQACHYTNLQPLWWQDNVKKAANYAT
jgi:hypothetical protein